MNHIERIAAHREFLLFKEETAKRLAKDRKQANLEMPSPIVKEFLYLGRLLRDLWREEESRIVNWQKEHELNHTSLDPEVARRKPIRITIERENVLGGERESFKETIEI